MYFRSKSPDLFMIFQKSSPKSCGPAFGLDIAPGGEAIVLLGSQTLYGIHQCRFNTLKAHR